MLYLDGSFQVKQIQSGRKDKVTTKRDVFIHHLLLEIKIIFLMILRMVSIMQMIQELNFYYGEKIHFVMINASLTTDPEFHN